MEDRRVLHSSALQTRGNQRLHARTFPQWREPLPSCRKRRYLFWVKQRVLLTISILPLLLFEKGWVRTYFSTDKKHPPILRGKRQCHKFELNQPGLSEGQGSQFVKGFRVNLWDQIMPDQTRLLSLLSSWHINSPFTTWYTGGAPLRSLPLV